MTRCAALALAALSSGPLAAVLPGCGTSDDGPVLTQLSFRGQAAQQPLTIDLSVSFRHPQGELGLGELHLSLDGEERSQLPLSDVFAAQSPALPLSAQSGAFLVEVSLEPPIVPGQKIEIGVFVLDRLGNESNEPTITLQAAGAAEESS